MKFLVANQASAWGCRCIGGYSRCAAAPVGVVATTYKGGRLGLGGGTEYP